MASPTVQQTFALALRHHQSGQLQQAEQLYRQILAQQPNHFEALHLLGVIAHQVGRNDAAVDLIRRAIALNPRWPETYYNLSNALRELGQFDQAVAACRQAIALRPNYPEACNNLGKALQDQGELDEAIAAYRQAIALKPDLFLAHMNLGSVLKETGRLDEALSIFRHVLALQPDCLDVHSNLLLDMHYHPGYDAPAIAREHRLWDQMHAQPLRTSIQPHLNDLGPDRRLRIGYVSPDFRNHSVGEFLLPLLAHHDKSRFEVFAYAQVATPDQMTQRLRSYTDGWRNIVGLSDAQAADLIRQDRIDILIDLAMHSAQNRLLVFARKPAPVQVTYLAYCSTTGLSAIDYRLSDPYLDPPGADESVYSERTIRLPETFWCYQPSVALPDVSPLPALAQGHITFGCLNNFCKVNAPALVAWARLLRAVPNSQLLLHAHPGAHRRAAVELLAREGIEPARVHFAGRVPLLDYFRSYHGIDVALDTFPFGGGTTTCNALWMGVPVVTLAGTTAVGRGGLSILSNVGLPELVAHSVDEYVQIAAQLAQDLPRLTALRATLRDRLQNSPLMNVPRFAQNIESLYRQIWQTWCASRAPPV